MVMLQPRFVVAEDQVLAYTRLEVGLKNCDEPVVLVSHRGVGVVEDRTGAGRHRLLGDVQRRRVLVHGDRSSRHVTRIHPEQLAVGHRRRQHDVGKQRVDHDHVLQRIPLVLGYALQVADSVEREHESMMRAERVEHRAVASARS
jgi:hypothetical protein